MKINRFFFKQPLAVVSAYLLVLLLCFCLMAWAEFQGLSKRWLGPIFLFFSVMSYASVGIYCRTTDPEAYYVANRQIPALFNGMATAADWISAASFISLAGALYSQGFSGTDGSAGGLAYLIGWTGGFCLMAMGIAPYLREMKLYTVPDYFDQRFGGYFPRVIAAWSAIICSFIYVVAQIYGVGLIASRLTGVQFEIGIMLGLGGVLLCSFLGGMRAITWTQVAQYVVLLFAFLLPVSWLAYKQLGSPLAPLVHGRLFAPIAALEEKIINDPAEKEVAKHYLQQAKQLTDQLNNVPQTLSDQRIALQKELQKLRKNHADVSKIMKTTRDLENLPTNPEEAQERWQRQIKTYLQRAKPLAGMPKHTQAFAGDPNGSQDERALFDRSRRNFLALVFCLMLGTAGLPHLITRYYTTPSVAAARTSVAWSLFFIAILYVGAPALAALVKFEVLHDLVGSSFENLPPWIIQWQQIDSALVCIQDVNGDGIVQLAELYLGADMVILAAAELGGLPYVISGLVAAGGLAAALSTADGLLLTISNALVHDLRFFSPKKKPALFACTAQSMRSEEQVIVSKFVLLGVAMIAAMAASTKPSEILPLVSIAFSLSGSALVPAMICGIFWRQTTRHAAVAGMLVGLGVTIYYQLVNMPSVRAFLGLSLQEGAGLWWDVQSVAAGVFGVPAGFLTIILMNFWYIVLIRKYKIPKALDGR